MLPGVIANGVSSCKNIRNEIRIFFRLFSNNKECGLEMITIQQVEQDWGGGWGGAVVKGEGHCPAAGYAFTDDGQEKAPLRKEGGNQAEQDEEKERASGKPGADSKEWDGQQDSDSTQFLRLGK